MEKKTRPADVIVMDAGLVPFTPETHGSVIMSRKELAAGLQILRGRRLTDDEILRETD